jgi:nicotianamine synthase
MKRSEEITAHIIAAEADLGNSRFVSAEEEYRLVFYKLEELVDDDPVTANEVLGNPQVTQAIRLFQHAYARCIFEMERDWTLRILEDASALTSYKKFDQYRLRVHLEVQMLSLFAKRTITSVLVVGCGPLPTTGILLASEFKLRTHCLDVNDEAIALARKVAQKLNSSIDQFILSNILDCPSLSDYDAIIIAQSVGMSEEEKKLILLHVLDRIDPGAVIILRLPYLLEEILIPKWQIPLLHCKHAKILLTTQDDIIFRAALWHGEK